jgi:hypothetical protein
MAEVATGAADVDGMAGTEGVFGITGLLGTVGTAGVVGIAGISGAAIPTTGVRTRAKHRDFSKAFIHTSPKLLGGSQHLHASFGILSLYCLVRQVVY